MKKLWFALKILAVAGAAFAALVDTGWLPQIPDWVVIVTMLQVGVGVGLLQKRAEFVELASDITDMFNLVQHGQMQPEAFRAKLLELIEDVKSIWSSVPFAAPPKPGV